MSPSFTHAVDDTDPIVVVGFAARLPGSASTPSGLWDILLSKKNTSTEVPADRCNIGAYYHSDWERPDTTNVRRANFITGDVSAFDAPFFAIQAVEAESMDPQQRILLETAYQALENSGIPLEKIAGTEAGVFVAASNRDYESMLFRDTELAPKYMGTGIGTSLLANRISWAFDLRGPSVPVDTACSGSLTALHFAHQSLRDGDSNVALVGGVSLILAPDASMTQLSTLGFLGPDGISYSFDSRANGYAKGEGAAVVVLKRLSDAIRDRDTIRAVLRATALNQDGRTPGITQPSQAAQTENIHRAYGRHGLNLDDTGYFEAHGTGTQMGDLIEASAIRDAFQRQPENPIYIGSLKANIGHMEAVAGAGALIKSILVLEEGILPPNACFEETNPKILEHEWGIRFLKSPRLFPESRQGIRRISVNNFGYGGANAHAVVDDAASYLRLHGLHANHRTNERPSIPRLTDGDLKAVNGTGNGDAHRELNGNGLGNGDEHHELNGILQGNGSGHHQLNGNGHSQDNHLPIILPFSSADESGLDRIRTQLTAYLADDTQQSHRLNPRFLQDLCYTLSERRSYLPWKSFAIVSSLEDLTNGSLSIAQAKYRSSSAPSVSYVFTGQGAQYFAMARDLDRHAVFAASIDRSEQLLKELGAEWSLKAELARDKKTSRVNEPELSQPLCTAVQIALADLLKAWGVKPVAVAGHSSGEIAAAYCARAISHVSAISVAFHRGQVVKKLAAKGEQSPLGGMLAVTLTETQAQQYIDEACEKTQSRASIGCSNSPSSMTITGDVAALDYIQSQLQSAGIFAKRVQVSVAYHSHYMEEVADDYIRALGRMSPEPLSLKQNDISEPAPVMFSSVTGERTTTRQLATADYWARNLVSRVQFTQAVQEMSAYLMMRRKSGGGNVSGKDVLVEIGPHSALQRPTQDIVKAVPGAKHIDYEASLSRNVDSPLSLATLAGKLSARGVFVDLLQACITSHTNDVKLVTDLPAYPFNHTRTYWCESRISKNRRFRKHGRHELLGTQEQDWNPLRPRWRNLIRLNEQPWIRQHKFGSFGIYPATGILVMVLEGVRQLVDDDDVIEAYQFDNVAFLKAFVVPTDSEIMEAQLQLSILDSESDSTAAYEFAVFGLVHDEWTECCKGAVSLHLRAQSTQQSETMISKHFQALELDTVVANSASESWKSVGDRQFYRSIGAMGYTFGDTFQSMTNVRYAPTGGEALANIILDAWSKKVDAGAPTPHVIHPVDLDSFLQTAIPAHSKGATSDCPVFIPTSMRSLRISHRLLQRAPESKLTWVGKRTFEGLRETDSDLGAIDSEGHVCITLEGYRATHFNISDGEVGTSNAPSRLAYNILSKPDVDFLAPSAAQQLCLDSVDGSSIPDEYIDKLELVAMLYLQQAIEAITDEDRARMPAYLRKYMAWAEHTYSREQVQRLRLSAVENEALFGTDEQREAFLDTLLQRGGEGRLVVETARELVPILKGESDALELLFTTDLAKEWYKSPMFSLPVQRMMPFVDLLAHKNPSLEVLEVGAGTGGATRQILQTLSKYTAHDHATDKDVPRYKRYTFTDISSGFFDDAQETFAEYPGLEFMTLDISRDPANQGFADRQYDLIVCGAVLHATPDLLETLKNCRKLLKPGGRLIMVEPTAYETARASFTFGLVPGWWLSIEEERKYCPCVSVSRWHELLRGSGFGGVEFDAVDHREDIRHLFSGIVAVADGDTSSSVEGSMPVQILRSGSSATQTGVAQTIQAQLLATGTEASIVSLEDVSSSTPTTSDWIVLLELDGSFFDKVDEASWLTFKTIVATSRSILWASRTVQEDSDVSLKQGLSTGIGRNVLSEYPSVHFAKFKLGAEVLDDKAAASIVQVYRHGMANGLDMAETELTQVTDQICIPRFVANGEVNRAVHARVNVDQPSLRAFGADLRALELTVGIPGLMETLHFRDDPVYDRPLLPSDVEFEVKAVGLNDIDMLIASGQIPGNTFGLEGAGVVTRAGATSGFSPGQRVCGCVGTGAFKRYARADSSALLEIPDQVAFTDAAAFSFSFATAYYALVVVARLGEGETILVQNGASPVGQAAIQIARHVGASVLTTVGTSAERDSLLSTNTIAEANILSQDDFANETKRRFEDGVDVVFKTQPSSKQITTNLAHSIAPLGRFVQLSQPETGSSRQQVLDQPDLPSNVTFASVDIMAVANKSKKTMRKVLGSVAALLSSPANPLKMTHPLIVAPLRDIQHIFRDAQEDESCSKHVIELHADDEVPVAPSTKPTYLFDADATYVIAGGLGGLARSIVEWMVGRNARHFLLLSRLGARNNSAALALITRLRAAGVVIETPCCDITDADQLKNVIDTASATMPPIKGCIQGAMVLKDSILSNMTSTDLHLALSPKVHGTLHLSAALPATLAFFVLLSSISGAIGTQAQGNYAAANTFQDAVATHLVAQGRHCVSLNLGVILNVGYAAEKSLVESLNRDGFQGLPEPALFALLEYACNPACPAIRDPTTAQLVSGLQGAESFAPEVFRGCYWTGRPMCRYLLQLSAVQARLDGRTADATDESTPAAQLAAASEETANDVCTALLTLRMASLLNLPLADIDPRRPISAFGIDSLISLELKNWIARELRANTSVLDIMGAAGIEDLAGLVVGKTGLRKGGEEEVVVVVEVGKGVKRGAQVVE